MKQEPRLQSIRPRWSWLRSDALCAPQRPEKIVELPPVAHSKDHRRHLGSNILNPLLSRQGESPDYVVTSTSALPTLHQRLPRSVHRSSWPTILVDSRDRLHSQCPQTRAAWITRQVVAHHGRVVRWAYQAAEGLSQLQSIRHPASPQPQGRHQELAVIQAASMIGRPCW